MDRAIALANAAHALVGTPFRLQGRDPAQGLDCIGLVLVSLERVGVTLELPADYRPRRRSFAIPSEALRREGLLETQAPPLPGDILLFTSSPAQVHLAIAYSGATIVHAHAGLGRVVACPPLPHWPLLAAWRLAPQGISVWQR